MNHVKLEKAGVLNDVENFRISSSSSYLSIYGYVTLRSLSNSRGILCPSGEQASEGPCRFVGLKTDPKIGKDYSIIQHSAFFQLPKVWENGLSLALLP